MIQSKSAGHAKTYFSEALSKSDYYIDDQEIAGSFRGQLAVRLGLEGKVSKEVFFALCENINPKTGVALTPRNREDRTVGYDINFHCPKSVSILHSLSKDSHISDAFMASVEATMKAIEADAKTRVRKAGQYDNRSTQELIWAEFMHMTARPVDGLPPDPHLHSHCFVFNATWDAQEMEIKAGQFRDIKRDMPYYQALFHKQFSDKLIQQGYRIRRTAKSFEIVGVPQKVIELFSKRTDEIGQFAKEHGITDAKKLSELGALTRSKKQKGMSMTELKSHWRNQIADIKALPVEEKEMAVRFAPALQTEKMQPQQCVDYALQHSFERVSVIPERRLLGTAFRYGIGDGNVSSDAIERAMTADSRVISVMENGECLCTTKAVLKEEKDMVALARQGRGKMKPLYAEPPSIKLQGQQRNAVNHILTTSNMVSIVMGAAGSGKTTLMKEAVSKIEAAGKKVVVVAPTAEASKGVLVQEGFENAETVARLLVDKQQQENLKDQVLWVDEAGLLGTKDMTALLALATKQNAMIILGGDTRQHASVVRGDALRILNTVGKIRAAEVSKIYRQKPVQYKSAVEDLSKGKVRSAFEKLSSMEAIQQVDPLKPNEDLVKDYVGLIKEKKTALIVSPTHKQGEEVTDEVRKKLRSAGMIGKKEIEVKKFDNLNFTEAQKSDWRNFKQGQIVQFNQNLRKIKRGSVWTIRQAESKGVVIVNENGDKRSLPQTKPETYDILEMSAIKLSKGDKIKITRNGFDECKKRLNNGQTLEVQSVNKKGRIKVQSNDNKASYLINQDFGHIAHAHCITSYAAQGKTVDHVLIAQPAATFPATDAKQFYVSVSRARESVRIYTDDRIALLEYASQLGDRQSAIELVDKGNSHLDHVIQKQRSEPSIQPQKNNGKEKINSLTKVISHDYEPRV